MESRIFLSPPHLNGSELYHFEQVLNSGYIAPIGPQLDQFENKICKYVERSHGCALNSATAAIHIGLKLLGVDHGDYVIVQSHNFIGCVAPIKYLGANPIFIDSERDTWNMDPSLLGTFLEEVSQSSENQFGVSIDRIKAIIPVHIYGMPAKMDELISIANRYDIPILEDAAEALGASYLGQKCGAFGHLSVVSFNGNKIITTGGGGFLASNDRTLIQEAKFLSTQARDPFPYYEHSQLGYNYRMSNVNAGLGIAQMKNLEERVIRRRHNHQKYRDYFKSLHHTVIGFQNEREQSFCNRWLTCILIDPKENKGITRENVRLTLEERNIETRPLWKPMHLQPLLRNEIYVGGNVSERLFNHGLCLPSGSSLTNFDFDRIFDSLDSIFS